MFPYCNMTTSVNLTGYGPRRTLLFDGNESKYELWEVKFLGICTTWLSQKKVKTSAPNAEKRASAFAERIECLDDRISLVISEANNDGRGARKVLRERY